jgi:ribosomal protein L37E
MLVPVYCRGCGQRLEIPEGFAKAKLRCAECGVYTELPPDLREQLASAPPTPKKAVAAPVAAAPRVAPPAEADDVESCGFITEPPGEKPAPPSETVRAKPPAENKPETPAIPERELLVQGTEEDDLNPYTVHGDRPTRMCPECDQRSDARAKACVHCGYHFESGAKAKREYEPLRREWENGWPLQKRLTAFMCMQAVNFVLFVLTLLGGATCVGFFWVAVMIGLQAFLVGTFEKLFLSRDSKNKVKLTRVWRYAFFARPPINVKWRQHDALIIVQSNDFSPIDWAFAIVLLCYAIVPGVLFWWFVIRPDKFSVFLCKDHGFPETPIFRTQNEELAKEIQTVVGEVTLLPIQR